MDFFSIVGVNLVEDEPETFYMPITLSRPATPDTKIFRAPHFSFLGLPIQEANGLAPAQQYGYYENGVFVQMVFMNIEYNGRMVFNKPSLDSVSESRQNMPNKPHYTDVGTQTDRAEVSTKVKTCTLVAEYVNDDPDNMALAHKDHRYFNKDHKWYVFNGKEWIHMWLPSSDRIKVGWYKFVLRSL